MPKGYSLIVGIMVAAYLPSDLHSFFPDPTLKVAITASVYGALVCLRTKRLLHFIVLGLVVSLGV